MVAAAQAALADLAAKSAIAHSSHANEAVTAVDLSGYLPPHVAAGSPNGGQFGTTSGGGSSTPSPAQAHAAHTAHVAHLQHLVAAGKATPAQRAELAGLRKAGPPTAPSALVAAAKTAALAAAKAKVASAAASKKPAAVKKATAVKKPAAVKPKTPKPKAVKVKATPGHPVVNKKKGTVTAVVNGKQVTMRLHEWHVIHVAHQQAVARQKALKAGVKFAGGDSDRWLDLAFTEALAERVPPGRPEGGRFTPVAAQLGRYDTPEQAAKVINALEPGQRAMVRTTTLPPPGFTWQEHDRLTVAE